MLVTKRAFGVELEAQLEDPGDDARTELAHYMRERGRSSCVAETRDFGDSHGAGYPGFAWKVEYDGSLNEGGAEVVSPILHSTASVREAAALMLGFDAYTDAECGTHVHIDGRDLDWEARRRVVFLWARLEETLYALVNAERSHNGYCPKTFTGYASRPTWRRLQEVPELVRELAMLPPSERMLDFVGGRRGGLNLNNLRTHGRGSIEFRLHHGTLDGDALETWIALLVALVDTAAEPERYAWAMEVLDLGFDRTEVVHPFLLVEALHWGDMATVPTVPDNGELNGQRPTFTPSTPERWAWNWMWDFFDGMFLGTTLDELANLELDRETHSLMCQVQRGVYSEAQNACLGLSERYGRSFSVPIRRARLEALRDRGLVVDNRIPEEAVNQANLARRIEVRNAWAAWKAQRQTDREAYWEALARFQRGEATQSIPYGNIETDLVVRDLERRWNDTYRLPSIPDGASLEALACPVQRDRMWPWKALAETPTPDPDGSGDGERRSLTGRPRVDSRARDRRRITMDSLMDAAQQAPRTSQFITWVSADTSTEGDNNSTESPF